MSVLSASIQKQVEDLLVEKGLLTREEMEANLAKAEKSHTPLFSLLINEKKITNEDLTKAIAKVSGTPYVNLTQATIGAHVLDLLPKDVAERYMAVPIGRMQNRIAVAMLDADNIQATDFLSNKIGHPIKIFMASEEGIRAVLAQYDTKLGKDVMGSLVDSTKEPVQLQKTDNNDKDKVQTEHTQTLVQDSPISKALSDIIEFALRNRASDIHIEPLEDQLKIRCRIDGILREIMKLPKSTEAPLVSRVKILSNLKIDEHRIPQDGQFSLQFGDKKLDMRIAISPVVWGEQVVIRLLDKSGTSFKLEEMGYTGRALRAIRQGIVRPNGMILTSGPTGSGKTTSLYALIQEIKNDTVNIVTLEDPVEYKMDGVNQIQVNPEVGLTFATGLRSILRQDPDVVMVGEIRDKETATLAVQAALTGHLVFSTLHTNSAAGILPRLLDMEIEPFLIASTVHTVIGQRLVRRLEPKNREEYKSSDAETAAIKATLGGLLPKKADEVEQVSKDLGYDTLPLSGQNAYTLFRGTDTADAPNGYKGRMGIYEAFEVNDDIRNLIMKRATSSEIQRMAQQQGMLTMRQDGYLKALAGSTTLSEIDRVTAADAA